MQDKEQRKDVRTLVLSKQLNETVKRAIRTRLTLILEEEERSYSNWKENIKDKLTPTRQKDIRRAFEKRIAAYKITIHSLTPYADRNGDCPTFIKKHS